MILLRRRWLDIVQQPLITSSSTNTTEVSTSTLQIQKLTIKKIEFFSDAAIMFLMRSGTAYYKSYDLPSELTICLRSSTSALIYVDVFFKSNLKSFNSPYYCQIMPLIIQIITLEMLCLNYHATMNLAVFTCRKNRFCNRQSCEVDRVCLRQQSQFRLKTNASLVEEQFRPDFSPAFVLFFQVQYNKKLSSDAHGWTSFHAL